MTKLQKCDCKNPYMDHKYGHGIRVMNVLQKAGRILDSARCTVCKKVHYAIISK